MNDSICKTNQPGDNAVFLRAARLPRIAARRFRVGTPSTTP
jgi:hypothetical protein